MNNQLKTISYIDETAKEIVERFCGHVLWLVTVRHTYRVLFEDKEPSCQTLMEKTASWFFAALNRILQEYLLLECAKITDRAKNGEHENFTVDTVVRNICWPDDKNIQKELESLHGITEDFRGHIKLARDKLLAHLDRTAVLSGKVLGGFPEGKDRTFFDALQRICNITHEACFGRVAHTSRRILSGCMRPSRSVSADMPRNSTSAPPDGFCRDVCVTRGATPPPPTYGSLSIGNRELSFRK